MPSSPIRTGETMPYVRHQRISGHSPYEPVFGFSRALVAGDRVLVAGTAPVPPGGPPPPAPPAPPPRPPPPAPPASPRHPAPPRRAAPLRPRRHSLALPPPR